MNGLVLGAVKLVGSVCAGYAAEEAVVGMATNYYSSALSKGAIRIGGFVLGCMAEEAADGYLDRAFDKAADWLVDMEKQLRGIETKRN